MKRIIFSIIAFLALPLGGAGGGLLYALPMNVACISKATQIIHSGDTLFIFKDNIEMKSLIGKVDWYSTESAIPVQTDSEEAFTLEEGGYYIKKNGVQYGDFYVFQTKPTDIAMTVEPTCDNTFLHLTGTTDGYEYVRSDGSMGTYTRACTLDYNMLTWSGEAWTDSAVHHTDRLRQNMTLPALYGETHITLCYDDEIRSKLEMDSACVTDTLYRDSVIAIDFHLESLATTRGTKGEKSNELNRPTDQKIITATTSEEYSGILDVAFYSNPTPSPKPIFYKWSIYKASQLIATRSDKDIRYDFSEPGTYRVVCWVNSYDCKLDSQEMKVNIAESYLRVPNVFTPDGNGKNDEFRVSYRSLREFHCWVYNRWGKLVYDWTDPAKGWDGTINGRKAAEGAYFYVIRAMGTDAPKDAKYIGLKASYKKKQKNQDESVIGIYQMSGDINLLRRKE